MRSEGDGSELIVKKMLINGKYLSRNAFPARNLSEEHLFLYSVLCSNDLII